MIRSHPPSASGAPCKPRASGDDPYVIYSNAKALM